MNGRARACGQIAMQDSTDDSAVKPIMLMRQDLKAVRVESIAATCI